jgi:O-antigen/teichoic acid export membrane protein
MDRVTTTSATVPPSSRVLPPVLGRLLSGTFWLALRTPLQAIFVLWSTRLMLEAIGPDQWGAYNFAWGFGFLQFLLEFGISSALQRQISERWTKGDRDGVDRSIACGMSFYAAMALIQATVLLSLAYWPYMAEQFQGNSYRLVIRLLWLQALTAPCYGLSMVVTSVLQAARRYDFIPRYEVAIVILRFAILWVGLNAGFDTKDGDVFFLIVATQTLVSIGLAMGPAIWVMVRELGHVPHFRGARLADYRALLHISFYMFLIQLSVVLADRIDTTMLGLAIHEPGQDLAVYGIVSKPFGQIRQVGWMLASLVMPAVASLAAARDERGLDRIKYDAPRLHIGILLPVALLAWIYAGPFLTLFVGDKLGYDGAREAPLMRLFLIATVPLVLAVHAQMAVGMNKIAVIALAALGGSLINLPISYYLTLKLGVAGVIWGTVLTTLFSNFLIPGAYIFRVLEIQWKTYLTRTLGPPLAGAVSLVVLTWVARSWFPIVLQGGGPSLAQSPPLLIHLTLGCLAYLAGYLIVPKGREDLEIILRKLRNRAPA